MEQEKEPLAEGPFGLKESVLDLIIINVLALIAIAVVLTLPDGNILRVVFGIPFLLFLPGYAIVSMLWPKKDLGDLERIALSIGLSIATIIVIGFALNYTPWGISLVPILVACFGVVIVTSFLASYMRMRIVGNERFIFKFQLKALKLDFLKVDKITSILIAISIIIAGSVLVYVVLLPKQGDTYTEFYILDQNGTTSDYPKNLKKGENGSIKIGIVNHEGERTNYTVRINLINGTGAQNDTWNFSISIDIKEKYEQDFNFNITSNDTYRLEFLLYRGLEIDPYLELHLNDIIVRD
jgi:uncharacterized membrane protein